MRDELGVLFSILIVGYLIGLIFGLYIARLGRESAIKSFVDCERNYVKKSTKDYTNEELECIKLIKKYKDFK
jgi:hypothetical protein